MTAEIQTVTDNDKKVVLENTQALLNQGKYHQALSMLGSLEATMASWIKGKIYQLAAEEISQSFTFLFYPTPDLKSKHLKTLEEAYDCFYKTALSLPYASIQVRDYLNTQLWHTISKVEHEIARNRPIEEEEMDDYDYDCETQQITDYLIDELGEWTL